MRDVPGPTGSAAPAFLGCLRDGVRISAPASPSPRSRFSEPPGAGACSSTAVSLASRVDRCGSAYGRILRGNRCEGKPLADDAEKPCSSSREELLVFFQEWLEATVPDDEATFARVAEALGVRSRLPPLRESVMVTGAVAPSFVLSPAIAFPPSRSSLSDVAFASPVPAAAS